jgi:uncharacterized membrane protein
MPFFDISKNLLLAFVPLAIAYLLTRKMSPEIKWPLGLIWLLFLPNSAYMLTEFEHIIQAENMLEVLWLITVIAAGLAFMCWSLEKVELLINAEFGAVRGSSIMFCIFLLNSFGVHLGLVPRFNSWDVFIKLPDVVRTTVTTFDLQVVETTAIFTAVCFVAYEGYRMVVQQNQDASFELRLNA